MGDMGWLTGRLLVFALSGILTSVAGEAAGAQDRQPLPGADQAQAGAPAGSYMVTGRVICGDTQRPARFAQVTLLPTAGGSGGDFGGRGRRLSARTDLEGNFAAANVPAGDYFVTGSLTGYVNSSNYIQMALSAGTDPSAAAPGVSLLHVGTGGGSTSLTLQRGGVIAGTVQWDDGTPAAGVQVAAQLAPATGVSSDVAAQEAAVGGNRGFSSGGGFGGAQTDDRGRYRLTGLAPGVYLLRASLQVPVPIRGDERAFTRTFNLFVYAPNKMRQTEAGAVTIAGAEEHGDLAIILALAGMHSISGAVSSSGTAPVRSGTVSLADQTDASLNRAGFIGTDGRFTIVDVPPGNYSLSVNASAVMPGSGNGGQTAVRFQPLQESITVADGDLTGLTLNVTAATPAPGSQ